ncbi:multidrug effflux MFS transporter [Mangrovicella endophytica]|uniref:multidrug effflux MFS transporter n=1 Tax=Mangrovicella endophytica TaxID=2066697 RepID=UPI000C9E343C|nr:multidrug effflux MFS transporter [Mangrovicella endophytica]
MSHAPDRGPAGRLPYWELVTLIASLMALNAAAIDIFIPSLQNIGAALGVNSENERQFVITAYVTGFGVAQIFYGTLSDRFGRRPVLLAGLGVYCLASFLAILSSSFEMLLALRVLQGVGAAATRVIAVSVVRDCFGGPRMASVMSLVMMIFMVIPVVAPNVGQAIMLFGSWQEVFLFTALLGLAVTVWAALRLPETLHPEDRLPLTMARVANAFRIVVTTRRSFAYAVGTSLMFGVLFGFINQAEQIYRGVYQIGDFFTVYFSAAAIFMALSSFVNSQLVMRFGMRRLAHMAHVSFIALAGVHLTIAALNGGAAPFWLFLPLMILSFGCFGFIGTNYNALSMDPLGHVAGTASSVLGFLQTLGGGLCGAIIGYYFDGTTLPLLSGFLVLSVLALGLVAIAEDGRLFRRLNQHKAASPMDALSNDDAKPQSAAAE